MPRAYPGAAVSTPLDWSEVKKGLEPHQFNIHNVLDRFERVGDLFALVLTNRQRIEASLERMGSAGQPVTAFLDRGLFGNSGQERFTSVTPAKIISMAAISGIPTVSR